MAAVEGGAAEEAVAVTAAVVAQVALAVPPPAQATAQSRPPSACFRRCWMRKDWAPPECTTQHATSASPATWCDGASNSACGACNPPKSTRSTSRFVQCAQSLCDARRTRCCCQTQRPCTETAHATACTATFSHTHAAFTPPCCSIATVQKADGSSRTPCNSCANTSDLFIE